MRSLETRRHHDLDQVDPEYVSKIGRETSWDDLKNVPFSGEQKHLSRDEVLQKMNEAAKFGKQAREKREDEDLSGMSLSEISETF